MRFPFLLCVVWVGLLVGATGCSLSPLSKRTASFATVAVAATKDSASAYEVVERSDYDVQVASLVLNFDKDDSIRRRFSRFCRARTCKRGRGCWKR